MKLSQDDSYGRLEVLSQSYRVQLYPQKRLSGVLMEHGDPKCRQSLSYSVFVNPTENWRNVPVHQMNGENYTILTFASRHEYVSHLTIQPDSGGTRGNLVTRAELVTLSDYCGHPEIPINGHVQWMTNDITACYSCDQGFRLNANSQIRRCIQGSWDGPEPTCMTFLQVKWI